MSESCGVDEHGDGQIFGFDLIRRVCVRICLRSHARVDNGKRVDNAEKDAAMMPQLGARRCDGATI